MAAFVKQCDHVVVRQQSGLAVLRRREVAREVNNGTLLLAADTTPVAFAVHPGPTLLSLAGIEVDKQIADGIVARQHFEGFDIREIGRASCRERVCQYVYL